MSLTGPLPTLTPSLVHTALGISPSPQSRIQTAKGLEGHPNFSVLSTFCPYSSCLQIYFKFEVFFVSSNPPPPSNLLQATLSRSRPSSAVTQLNSNTPDQLLGTRHWTGLFVIAIPSPHHSATAPSAPAGHYNVRGPAVTDHTPT